MGSDTVNANKAYFDKLAAEYDGRFEKTISQLVEEIQKRRFFISVDWVEDDDDDEADGEQGTEQGAGEQADDTPVKLLDYACGTGLISRALAQYTSQCVGIDLSENMVAAYNARAENQGLAKEEMHAYQGNMTDPSDPNPASLSGSEFFGFDVAAVGLGFHHFDDPEYSAKQLVQRLKPGGVLFILDFLPHAPMEKGHGHGHGHSHADNDTGDSSADGHPHQAAHTVMHHGFSEERVRAIFEGAGAGKDFSLAELGSGVVFHGHGGAGTDMKRRVFLARGVKG